MKKWMVALTLLLASCCSKPGLQRPCYIPHPQWRVQERTEITSLPSPRWWEQLDDPSLNELITIGDAYNLDLRQALYRIAEARAAYGVTIGEFFPQQQVAVGEAGMTRISKNTPNTAPTTAIQFKNYLLGLQASWELDIWGKFRSGIRAAEADFAGSIANYEDVLVLLHSDIAAFYIRYRTLEELMEIIVNNVKVQKRSLEIATARFEGGFVTELDVQQVKVLLNDTKSRLPDLEREKQQVENALSVLLGMAPSDLSCLIQGEKKLPHAPVDLVVMLPACMLETRPDITRARADVAAQAARVGVAITDLYPQISLTGFLGLESTGKTNMTVTGSSGKLLNRSSLSYDYGIGFSWPILNYGRIINSIRVEDARLQQQTIAYRQTVLRAYQEVEDGLVAFLKGHDQTELLSESQKAASRSLDLSKTQYVEGAISFTRVLNSLEALLDEEERLVRAKSDTLLGLVATYRALGQG